MLEVTMNSPATPRSAGRSRLALMAAGVLALLGSFVVPAPAQAGYYDNSYPCSYRCGYRCSPYRCAPRYYNGCSACGCGRRCNSGLVYERRYVEREYVERRYGRPCCHYRRHYGYNPYGGYRPSYGGYGGYRSPYYGGDRPWPRPLGYGGVRSWGGPYGYPYQPSAERYEETPRPPAPVWDGAGYEDGDWR